MEIRPIRLDELECFARIERQAFVMSQDETEQYTQSRYRTHPENTRVLVEQGEIVSQLYILPNHLWLGADTVKVVGIDDVATPPQYRRYGYLKTLLTQVLEELHTQQGYAISVLHPFSFPFYRNFGYELFCTKKQVRVNIKALSGFRDSTLIKGCWLPITPSEWATLDAVYLEFCRGRFGRLTRTDEWWQQAIANSLKSNDRAAFMWQDVFGRSRAYISYAIRLGENGEREMVIRERVWLDQPAYHALLSFIASHDAQVSRVIWHTEESEDIFGLLSDPAKLKNTFCLIICYVF